MGRRKKEPLSAHREKIAAAAEKLFDARGADAATMNDIAFEAGYSKATLYVYFADKDEILDYLTLKSMKELSSRVNEALAGPAGTRAKYQKLCSVVADYCARCPLYADRTLAALTTPPSAAPQSVGAELSELGARLNRTAANFINAGVAAGELIPDTPVWQSVFLLWTGIFGIVRSAREGESYLQRSAGVSRQAHLDLAFDRAYRMFALEDGQKSSDGGILGSIFTRRGRK